MKCKPLPHQDTLNALFTYDPDTGILRNKVKRGPSKPGVAAGSIHWKGYLVISINQSQYRVHRLIWKMAYGKDPGTLDHINRDRLDNRLENLRAASDAENSHNHKMYNSNTSGCTGLSYDKWRGLWVGQLVRYGKRVRFGRSKDKQVIIDRLLEFRAACTLNT